MLVKLQAYRFKISVDSFIKKETLAQVFSCEFSEIFKNTFSTDHLRTIASVITQPAYTCSK